MTDHGIKVVEPGKAITSTDIRDLILSSQYTMLKYHSDNTASLTITAGDTEGSVDISHSLSDIPAYISYVELDWYDTTQRMLPFGVPGNPVVVFSSVDSSKVRCHIRMTSQGSDRTFNFRVVIFKDQIA
jgi:hypothetical protein|tara:strand:+ start:1356 stop:1742 length:387 start_codon:yes stop_codon:yes gene_type:complete